MDKMTTAEVIVSLSETVSELASDHQARVERLEEYCEHLGAKHKELIAAVARVRSELTLLETITRDAFGELGSLLMGEQTATAGKLIEADPRVSFKAILGGKPSGAA